VNVMFLAACDVIRFPATFSVIVYWMLLLQFIY
jgi:hypothetical protein